MAVLELQLHHGRVAVRVDQDGPQDVHIFVLAGLDVLVQDPHPPPVFARRMCADNDLPQGGEEGAEPPHEEGRKP